MPLYFLVDPILKTSEMTVAISARSAKLKYHKKYHTPTHFLEVNLIGSGGDYE